MDLINVIIIMVLVAPYVQPSTIDSAGKASNCFVCSSDFGPDGTNKKAEGPCWDKSFDRKSVEKESCFPSSMGMCFQSITFDDNGESGKINRRCATEEDCSKRALKQSGKVQCTWCNSELCNSGIKSSLGNQQPCLVRTSGLLTVAAIYLQIFT